MNRTLLEPTVTPHRHPSAFNFGRSAILLVFITGLVGCSSHRDLSRHGPQSALPPCGAFAPSTPFHPSHVDVNITTRTPNPVPITVKGQWTAPAGCRLKDGVARIYFLKNNIEKYCGKTDLKPQGPNDPNFQTVTVYVPLGVRPSLNLHDVRRLVTGTFTDGSVAVLQTDLTIPVLGCIP